MAAPGISLANPSAQGQDGLSGMLARIKERAAQRRGGLSVDPQELTPLASMDASDSLQAANFDGGESPMVAAIGSSGGSGGVPARFASMGEGDEGEITPVQYDCADGRCGPQPGMDGIPAGAQIISERVVGQGVPMQGGVVSMPGEVMAAPQYYPKEVGDVDGEYRSIANPTTQDTVRWLHRRMGILSAAANAPGVPARTQALMANEAAANYRDAMELTANSDVIKAVEDKNKVAMEEMRLKSPEGRMRDIRAVIAGPENYLTDARQDPAEVRVSTIMDAEARDRGADLRIGDDEAFQRREQLMQWAVASDLSLAIAKQEAGGMTAFGKDRDTHAMFLAAKYYGPLNPAAREEMLMLDLKPAIEARLAQTELRRMGSAAGGQGASLSPEKAAEIDGIAFGHVRAIQAELNRRDKARGMAGSQSTLTTAPPKAPTQMKAPPAGAILRGSSVIAPEYQTPSIMTSGPSAAPMPQYRP